MAIERDAVLEGVERAIAGAGVEAPAGPLLLRRVGEPFVTSWLERETRRSSVRYFPLFGLFVVALVLFLYWLGG